MGSKFVEGRSVEFSKSYEESNPSTPIFFILSPGVDPLKDVEALGKCSRPQSPGNAHQGRSKVPLDPRGDGSHQKHRNGGAQEGDTETEALALPRAWEGAQPCGKQAAASSAGGTRSRVGPSDPAAGVRPENENRCSTRAPEGCSLTGAEGQVKVSVHQLLRG